MADIVNYPPPYLAAPAPPVIASRRASPMPPTRRHWRAIRSPGRAAPTRGSVVSTATTGYCPGSVCGQTPNDGVVTRCTYSFSVESHFSIPDSSFLYCTVKVQSGMTSKGSMMSVLYEVSIRFFLPFVHIFAPSYRPFS